MMQSAIKKISCLSRNKPGCC